MKNKKYFLVIFSTIAIVYFAFFGNHNVNAQNIFNDETISSGDCNIGDYDICTNLSGIKNTQNINSNQNNVYYSPSTVSAADYLNPKDYPYCVYLTNTLSYKSSGISVSALQNYLIDRGFMENAATGFFGRATELAVKKFQNKNEIDVTGIAGPITRETIRLLTCDPITKTVTVNKPISPSGKKYIEQDLSKTSNTSVQIPVTSNQNETVKISGTVMIPSTKNNAATATNTNYTSVSIPVTNNSSNSKTILQTNNSKLNITSGTFSSSNKNNLYFTYKSDTSSPGICITLNSTDCTKSTNFQPLSDGASTEIFDASNLTGQWLFTLHYNNMWGSSGSSARVYLKENPNDMPSIYTVNVN